MKPVKNIEEILERHLPSAAKGEMESAGDRVLLRLRMKAGAAPSPHTLPVEEGGGRTWRRIAMGCAAAAVLLAVFAGAAVMWRHADAFAVVEAADGELERSIDGNTQTIQAGSKIKKGEIVRSNASGASLVMNDGSRIEMRSKTELALESADDGVRIRLNAGDVIVNAAKQHGHLYVQTKDVTVSVVGTVFFVSAEKTGSRVGVVEGEVHVQQGETTQKLFPGQQIVSAPSMPSTLVAEAIAWSHSAPAHMIELQRSTVIEPAPLRFDSASIRPDPQPSVGAALGPLLCRGFDSGDHFAVPPPPSTVFPSTAPLGRCVGRYVNLASLIAAAYDVPQRNISGGPDWGGARLSADEFQRGPLETFQIEARAEKPEVTTLAQLRQMLQSMLADRFQLKVRRETKQSPGFALVIAKGGLKLKQATGDEEPLEIHTGSGGGVRGEATSNIPKVVITGKASMSTFAAFFRRCPQMEGRLVVDKTGLSGIFDINLTLNWIPGPPPVPGVPITPTCTPSYDPPLSWALEDQLGLHLDPGMIVPEEFIVIDRAEKPSEN